MAFNAYDYLRDEARRRLEEQLAQQSTAGMERLGHGGNGVPLGSRSFLPVNNRPPQPINSLGDAIASNANIEQTLRGPMYAQDPAPTQPPDVSTMTRPRTTAPSPALRDLGARIRGDNAAVDKRAQDIGAMSHAEWLEAQRTGKIPVWTSHMQGGAPQTGTLDEAAQMTRPRRVFEQPPSTSTAGRPRFNDPITYDTSGMPDRRAHNYGAEPLDTSLQYREALQNWRPSGERSLGNTARGAGYGALMAAERFPGSGEALIGGGIAGLIASLVKPSSKNWMRRDLAMGQADAEVAKQLKIAGEQAKLRQMEINPYLKEVGLNQGQQRIDVNRDRLAQQKLLTHKRAMASVFNSYPEFDPDDPKSQAFAAAFEAVYGFRPPKKTRGSMFQMVEGTDAEGNATFSMVHKPTGSATKVTGTGLPSQTEGQLNRDARQGLEEYRQEQINEREARKQTETRGLTPGQIQSRRDRANALVAEIESARAEAEKAQRLANEAGADPAKQRYRASFELDRDAALERGNKAARELNTVFGDQYEAGSGEGGWPYYKEKARQEDPKIREYSNQYFDGDYEAAEEAVRQQRGGQQSTGARGQRWSASRWAAANPGKDVNAAIRAAKRAGYTVVD